ncbi:tyrosine-protein phosphatase [Fredinandcohnia sp. 179-A 10B2 NHS]|uniref:tyrosine-protein phosphatase n=1 Tax=Fredinandcohnia sp. 179-A 10B2 NHS TaxID=3235176 RepID=UPI00399EF451
MTTAITEIVLTGTFNFRDLGGYITKEGRKVKKGMLFRSGNLSRVTEKDLETISHLNIQKICDLRGVDEIEKYPDPVIDDAVWYHTPILSDDKMMGQVGTHSSFADELRKTKPGELLLNLNKNMISFKTAFQNVFNVLLNEPHTPMLFHCMAGKDRTGAVAALILSVLGVTREDIHNDYLYTNETLEQMNANFEEIGYNDLPNIDQDVIDSIMEARVEYIEAFLNELEIQYGSADTYCKEVLGLSTEDIDVLKTHLLE